MDTITNCIRGKVTHCSASFVSFAVTDVVTTLQLEICTLLVMPFFADVTSHSHSSSTRHHHYSKSHTNNSPPAYHYPWVIISILACTVVREFPWTLGKRRQLIVASFSFSLFLACLLSVISSLCLLIELAFISYSIFFLFSCIFLSFFFGFKSPLFRLFFSSSLSFSLLFFFIEFHLLSLLQWYISLIVFVITATSTTGAI